MAIFIQYPCSNWQIIIILLGLCTGLALVINSKMFSLGNMFGIKPTNKQTNYQQSTRIDQSTGKDGLITISDEQPNKMINDLSNRALDVAKTKPANQKEVPDTLHLCLGVTGFTVFGISLWVGAFVLTRYVGKGCKSKQTRNAAYNRKEGCQPILAHRLVEEASPVEKDYISKKVDNTWMYKDRLGRDTKGMTHQGIQPKHILRVDNSSHIKEYTKATKDMVAKQLPEELLEKPILTTLSGQQQMTAQNRTENSSAGVGPSNSTQSLQESASSSDGVKDKNHTKQTAKNMMSHAADCGIDLGDINEAQRLLDDKISDANQDPSRCQHLGYHQKPCQHSCRVTPSNVTCKELDNDVKVDIDISSECHCPHGDCIHSSQQETLSGNSLISHPKCTCNTTSHGGSQEKSQTTLLPSESESDQSDHIVIDMGTGHEDLNTCLLNGQESLTGGLKEDEIFLFHGTKVGYIPDILEHGFDLGKANSESKYGKAIYLAESSEKADQYADFPNDRRQTDLAMLVVRVKLGRTKYHKDDHRVKMPYKGGPLTRKPKYDMVVAGHDKRFREFLIFNPKLVYPEFVVLYDRIPAEDSSSST